MNMYGVQSGCPECQAYIHQQQQQQHQQHHCLRPLGQYLLSCEHFAVDSNTLDFASPNQLQHNHPNPGSASTQLSPLCMATPYDQQHYMSCSSSGDFGVTLTQNQFSPSLYMITTDSTSVHHSVLCVDPAASSCQFLSASPPYGPQPNPLDPLLPISHLTVYKEMSLPNSSTSVSPLSPLPRPTASAPENNQSSENYLQQFMNSTCSTFQMNGMTVNAKMVAQDSAALVQAERSVIKAGCAVAQSYNNTCSLPYTSHATTAPEAQAGLPMLAHEALQTPLDTGMCLSTDRASSTIPPLVASHIPVTTLGENQLSCLVSMSSSDGAVGTASSTSLHPALPGHPPYSFAPFMRPTPSSVPTEVPQAPKHNAKRNNGPQCSVPAPSRHTALLSSHAGTYAAPLSRHQNISASLTTFPIAPYSRTRGPTSSLPPSTFSSSARSDITFLGNTTPKTFGKRNTNPPSNGSTYVRQCPEQAQQENHYPFPTTTTALSHSQFPRQSSPAPLTSPPTKRLCNSYMLYRKNTFAKNKNYFKQSGSSGAAISREIAQRWNQEPESVKKLFELQAEMERHRVLQAFPDYKYKKRGPQKIKSTNGKMDGGTGAEVVARQNTKTSKAVENKTSCGGVKAANEGAQKSGSATPPRMALSIQQRPQPQEGQHSLGVGKMNADSSSSASGQALMKASVPP